MEEKRRITILGVLASGIAFIAVIVSFTLPFLSSAWVIVGFILMTVEFFIFKPVSNLEWWIGGFWAFYTVLTYIICIIFLLYSLKCMPKIFWKMKEKNGL